MTGPLGDWGNTIAHLIALAARLEGEGQYNLAKLNRAGAESLIRQAAFELSLPSEKGELVGESEKIMAELKKLGVDKELVIAMQNGTATMTAGRLPLIDETPHPYVCRTCGYVVLGAPFEKCPTCNSWPTTFKRFPPVYWLDALEPFDALERLRQTPLEVADLIAGLPENVLNQKPLVGGWAIRNILSHLRDAQGVLNFRLNLLLEEENPLLESKAVFEWATNEAERPATSKEIFETYQASRQDTIARLESIPLANWWRSGQHEEFGTVTVRQQVSYFASHELTHLPQIEALCQRT